MQTINNTSTTFDWEILDISAHINIIKVIGGIDHRVLTQTLNHKYIDSFPKLPTLTDELSDIHSSTDAVYSIIGNIRSINNIILILLLILILIGLLQGASTVVMVKSGTINVIQKEIAEGMYNSCLNLLKMIINVYHSLRKIDDFLQIVLSENTRGSIDHIKRKNELVDAFVSLFRFIILSIRILIY